MTDRPTGSGFSYLDITLDQEVTVVESRFPEMSFTKLFSDLGGSLGLWLGMGIIQICVLVVNMAFLKLRRYIYRWILEH